jgi:hypothetical protein
MFTVAAPGTGKCQKCKRAIDKICVSVEFQVGDDTIRASLCVKHLGEMLTKAACCEVTNEIRMRFLNLPQWDHRQWAKQSLDDAGA